MAWGERALQLRSRENETASRWTLKLRPQNPGVSFVRGSYDSYDFGTIVGVPYFRKTLYAADLKPYASTIVP